MTVPGREMLWVRLRKYNETMTYIHCYIDSEKSYSHSSENQVSCAKLISRVKDPDVWKPFLIVNLMFFLQIWNGMTPYPRHLIVTMYCKIRNGPDDLVQHQHLPSHRDEAGP